jgi:hypothetical protein
VVFVIDPENLQLAVNQRRGLTSRVQKIHAYLSPE